MNIIIINSAGPVAYLLCISLFSTQYIISWFSVLCIHIISAYESKFQHQHGLLFSTPTKSAIKNLIYLVSWHINTIPSIISPWKYHTQQWLKPAEHRILEKPWLQEENTKDCWVLLPFREGKEENF